MKVRGVLGFNFWQLRTLVPAAPVNRSKCLVALRDVLSPGARSYSKMLHLQLFPVQHMFEGGGWGGGSGAALSAPLLYSWAWARRGPAAEDGSAEPWEQGQN